MHGIDLSTPDTDSKLGLVKPLLFFSALEGTKKADAR